MSTEHAIVEHYAAIAAAPDPVIRKGWAEYLAKRVPELDKELPGIQEQIRERTREIMQGAAC